MEFGKCLLVGLLLSGCGTSGPETEVVSDQNQPQTNETIITDTPETTGKESYNTQKPKHYSNKRFRNVTIERSANDSFLVTGQGQIFEASFGWVIDDGHEELQSGFATTDMGAPEWGNFSFTVRAPKKRPNSTLHIVLFETSAMDGSRQHELLLQLY